MTSVKDPRQEFDRKVRTVLRGMTTLFEHPGLLNPLRAGVFAFELWSHKVLRWLAPVFLLGTLVSALALAAVPFYLLALAAQLAFYGLAVAAFPGHVGQGQQPLPHALRIHHLIRPRSRLGGAHLDLALSSNSAIKSSSRRPPDASMSRTCIMPSIASFNRPSTKALRTPSSKPWP